MANPFRDKRRALAATRLEKGEDGKYKVPYSPADDIDYASQEVAPSYYTQGGKADRPTAGLYFDSPLALNRLHAAYKKIGKVEHEQGTQPVKLSPWQQRLVDDNIEAGAPIRTYDNPAFKHHEMDGAPVPTLQSEMMRTWRENPTDETRRALELWTGAFGLRPPWERVPRKKPEG